MLVTINGKLFRKLKNNNNNNKWRSATGNVASRQQYVLRARVWSAQASLRKTKWRTRVVFATLAVEKEISSHGHVQRRGDFLSGAVGQTGEA